MRTGRIPLAPAAARLAVWLAVCLASWVLTGAVGVKAETTPAEPTPEQVKAFVEHKADPVVGTWVAQHLQGGAAAGMPVAATSLPASDGGMQQGAAVQEEVGG